MSGDRDVPDASPIVREEDQVVLSQTLIETADHVDAMVPFRQSDPE